MSLLSEREAFLKAIAEYIKHDPEASAYVANFVQAGLHSALSAANQRAADMEACLMLTIDKKSIPSAVAAKLAQWKNESSLSWDWILNKEKNINPPTIVINN